MQPSFTALLAIAVLLAGHVLADFAIWTALETFALPATPLNGALYVPFAENTTLDCDYVNGCKSDQVRYLNNVDNPRGNNSLAPYGSFSCIGCLADYILAVNHLDADPGFGPPIFQGNYSQVYIGLRNSTGGDGTPYNPGTPSRYALSTYKKNADGSMTYEPLEGECVPATGFAVCPARKSYTSIIARKIMTCKTPLEIEKGPEFVPIPGESYKCP